MGNRRRCCDVCWRVRGIRLVQDLAHAERNKLDGSFQDFGFFGLFSPPHNNGNARALTRSRRS